MKRLSILFALFSIACHSGPAVNGLPAERPKDLKLSYHLDGGMVYHSEDLTITADSCVSDINNEGKKTHTVFMLSSAELDGLYSVLQKNKFDKIGYRTEGEVYDRGGITMSLSWDKDQRKYQVNDSQMSFVLKDWEKEWRAICDYVEALAKGK